MRRLLLLDDTESSSSSTSGISSLSSALQSPEVSESLMLLDFLEFFEIFSLLGVNHWWNELGPVSFSWAVLSVEHPLWNSVIGWSSEDIIDSFLISEGNLSGSLGEIDSGNFENSSWDSSTDTFDAFKSELSSNVTLYVCILDSQNMSIIFIFHDLEWCLYIRMRYFLIKFVV